MMVEVEMSDVVDRKFTFIKCRWGSNFSMWHTRNGSSRWRRKEGTRNDIGWLRVKIAPNTPIFKELIHFFVELIAKHTSSLMVHTTIIIYLIKQFNLKVFRVTIVCPVILHNFFTNCTSLKMFFHFFNN